MTETSISESYQGVRHIPPPPRERGLALIKWMGPGIVCSALVVGSGELILCSYAGAKAGGGLAWALAPALFFKFWLQYEAARYQILTGETPFHQLKRIHPAWAWVFTIVGLVAFIFPGNFVSSGTTLYWLSGAGSYVAWTLVCYVLSVLILAFPLGSPSKMMEYMFWVTSSVMLVMTVLSLAWVVKPSDLAEMGRGMVTVSFPAELGAFWILSLMGRGIGGPHMTTLSFNYYLRERGYGMNKYAGTISTLLKRGGKTTTRGWWPDTTPDDVENYRRWMRIMLYGAALLGAGLTFAMVFMYMLLGSAVLRPLGLVPSGLKIALVQGELFAKVVGPAGYIIWLVLASVNLFDTGTGIVDNTSRIVADTMVSTIPRAERYGASRLYWWLVAVMVVGGMALIWSGRPLWIVAVTGVLGGAFWYSIHLMLLWYWNRRHLPKPYKPGWISAVGCGSAIVFFLIFTVGTILNYLGVW